eukprot:gene10647-biopygen7634
MLNLRHAGAVARHAFHLRRRLAFDATSLRGAGAGRPRHLRRTEPLCAKLLVRPFVVKATNLRRAVAINAVRLWSAVAEHSNRLRAAHTSRTKICGVPSR